MYRAFTVKSMLSPTNLKPKEPPVISCGPWDGVVSVIIGSGIGASSAHVCMHACIEFHQPYTRTHTIKMIIPSMSVSISDSVNEHSSGAIESVSDCAGEMDAVCTAGLSMSGSSSGHILCRLAITWLFYSHSIKL